MANVGVEIVGMPEVKKLLAGYQQPELDVKVKKGLQSAGRTMAKGVRQAAPSEVRRGVEPGFGRGSSARPGTLYKSIRSRTLRGSPPGVAVGPMAAYRHLAIRPTQPHIITPLTGHFLAVASGGRFASIVHHPGNRAHPWVEQGLTASHDRALEAARKAIFRNVMADRAPGDD